MQKIVRFLQFLLLLCTFYVAPTVSYAAPDSESGDVYTVNLTSQSGNGTPGTLTSVLVSNGAPMPAIADDELPRAASGQGFIGYFDGEVQYYNPDGTSAQDWDRDAGGTLVARFETCSVGYYNDGTHAACVPASPGHFVPWEGRGDEMKCPLGTYSEAPTASTTCTVCPPGTVTVAAGTPYADEPTDVCLDLCPRKDMVLTWTANQRWNPGAANVDHLCEPETCLPAVAGEGANGAWFTGARQITNADGFIEYECSYGTNCTNGFDSSNGLNVTVVRDENGTPISAMVNCTEKNVQTYTVTLDVNGGTGGTRSVTVAAGGAMPAITTPIRDGYNFLGYYDEETDGTRYYTPTGTSARTWNKDDDATLYAHWELATYEITYVMNGGTNVAGNPASYTINDTPITLLPPATRDEYTFEGWYSDANFTHKITGIASGETGDITLYAHWTGGPCEDGYVKNAQTNECDPITYTISYVLNGGTNNAANPTEFTVVDLPIILGNPARSGYVFDGWYTNAGFTGNAIESITTIDDKTLYAKWSLPPCGAGYERDENTNECVLARYTITYHLNDDANTITTDTYTINDVPKTLMNPDARDGYEFDGWYAGAGLTGSAVTIISAASIGNKTFYAKWNQTVADAPCPSGQWLNTNNNQCSDCPTGTYSAADSSACVVCPVGRTTEGDGTPYNSNPNIACSETCPTAEFATGWHTPQWTPNNGLTNLCHMTGCVQNDNTHTSSTWGTWGYLKETQISPGVTQYECYYSASCQPGYHINDEGDKIPGMGQDDQGNDAARFECVPDGKQAYTVSFKINGATWIDVDAWPLPKTVVSGDSVSLLTGDAVGVAYKTEHQFLGWSTTPDGATIITGNSFVPTENTTLYAIWGACPSGTTHPADPDIPMGECVVDDTPTEYTITYVLNGGTNAASNPAGYTDDDTPITLDDPTRADYVFMGWYSDADLRTPVTEIPAGSTGDITLYARWVSMCYRVEVVDISSHYIYLYQGRPDVYYTDENCQNLGGDILTPPTRDYSVFLGYMYGQYTGEEQCTDGNGVILGNCDRRDPHSSIIWWAKWECADGAKRDAGQCQPITYNIIYELDGGTNNADNPSTYSMATVPVTLTAPTREGYTFDGWYTDAAFTTPITEIPTGSTGDITLYAKWMVVEQECPAGQWLDPDTDTCTDVGPGYWSPDKAITRTACETGLTTIGYGVGADEAGDCGRKLHAGNNIIYLRSVKKTTPSLHVQMNIAGQDKILYGNMAPDMTLGKLHVRHQETDYSVYDDSMLVN